MDLKTLQEQFVTQLCSCSSQNKCQTQELAQLITSKAGLSVEERIAIYRQSIFAKDLKVLQAIYPVCLALVGEQCFKATAQVYLTHHDHQCSSFDITGLGENFPLFLASFDPLRSLPYLADVARLEWHCHQAIKYTGRLLPGNRSEVNKLSEVTATHMNFLCFDLPSGGLIRSDYPILRIWQANQREGHSDEHTIDLQEGGCLLLVHCHAWDLAIESLSAEEYKILSCFAQGLPFGQSCKLCLQVYPRMNIPMVFSRLITQGWLLSFYRREEGPEPAQLF